MTRAFYAQPAKPLTLAGSGVKAALTRGVASTCVQILGDSTGTDTNEWFGVMGQRLGDDFPEYTVRWRQWNTTSQEYDLPSDLQTGTGNGGGERYVLLASGAMNYTGTAAAADHEVRAKVMPTAGWAPGGGAALRTIVSRYNASGSNRAFHFAINESGNLTWTWSANGTSDVATVVSTAAVPFANGTAGWVRVTFDVDNGASGNTATFYTSTDGVTWSALGSPVVTATATSIATTETAYRLGAIGSTPTNMFAGRIYWVDVRNALSAGQALVPPLPDDWEQYTTSTSNTVTFGGAPVLMLLCGSASGQAIAYFNDSTRRLKLNAPHGQQLVFLNDGHNEGNSTGYGWRSTYGAWVTDVKTRLSACPIVCVAQNKTQIGAQITNQRGVDLRTIRGQVIMAYAASQGGVYGLDVWPQFDGQDLDEMLTDGLHPGVGSGSGSELWGLYAYRQIFA